jgi:hypothetical protein
MPVIPGLSEQGQHGCCSFCGVSSSPDVSYKHDIYSPGVVLLEIGLWQTIKQIYEDMVRVEFDGIPPPEGVPANTIKAAYLEDAETRLAFCRSLVGKDL